MSEDQYTSEARQRGGDATADVQVERRMRRRAEAREQISEFLAAKRERDRTWS